MITTKSIAREIGELRGLGDLVTTYEFIAAAAMRRIRNSVLENRAFHLGLNAIFQEIKRAYEREVHGLAQQHGTAKKKTISFVTRDRKSAIVFLSANTPLYGEVIARTFSAFVAEAEKNVSDAVVVGRIGRTLFEETFPARPFAYFDFPDTSIAIENLKAISTYLTRYERVLVFHGRFKSLISQEAAISSISGDLLAAPDPEKDGEETKYIFEPSLETIVIFFETEILGSLLEQVFHESRLAKLASRMVLLDRASVAVDRAFVRTVSRRSQLQHRVFNRKQLDSLAGVGMWFRP
ncbi:MAG: hypothetical protein UY60_C0018G0003 [Parcubacteria group bacterium GW2011_GWB1_50_9]|nr:MAG: hypothetical protein UY60_C0018G0003 [Parcubacteria group bacterium GW2011_GWB1_50_9]KKW33510.1 MAG: hypothetical protein UY78_C0010G0005 [Parcubacteria group bacterium GW2011_GWA1_53_13]